MSDPNITMYENIGRFKIIFFKHTDSIVIMKYPKNIPENPDQNSLVMYV